jgi:hypothetical protein
MEPMPADPVNADQILPFVKRAINDLGYMKEDRAAWLANFIFDNFNQGSQTFNWRRSQPQISDADKLNYGYNRSAHVPVILIDALTAKGLVSPLEHFTKTITRTLNLHYNRYRYEALCDLVRQTWVPFDKIRFLADEKASCPAALKLDGVRFPLDAIPELPLPGCLETPCWCDCVTERIRR